MRVSDMFKIIQLLKNRVLCLLLVPSLLKTLEKRMGSGYNLIIMGY